MKMKTMKTMKICFPVLSIYLQSVKESVNIMMPNRILNTNTNITLFIFSFIDIFLT